MKHHRGAVAYCVRADARRSWPSWLALGVLVGLAAGAVMAATAAGNRTDSAYRDLRDETAAMDGAIALPCAVEDPATCPVIGEIRAWPGVADAARFSTGAVPILDIDGHLVQANNDTCYSGSGAVNLITPIDPEFGTSLHRLRLLEGRLADPTRADEVVMAPLAAEALGVGVGDRLFPRPVDCLEDAERWGAPIPVTVVGIGLTALEVPPKNGLYLQGIHTTPAFAELLPEREGGGEEGGEQIAVRLDPGTSFADLADTPGVTPFDVVFDEATIGDPVDEGLRTDANAVWLVAALVAATSAFVLGPTLARYRAGTAEVDRTLSALGWSRQDRVLRSGAHGIAIGTVAGSVALGVMALVSHWTPIGDARTIEPSPGMEIDLSVLLVGTAVTLLVVTLGLMALAWRALATRTPLRRTPLAGLAARVGLAVPAVLGIRIGLEPERGGAPVRSSILAVAVGATAITGALAYTSSAQHLRETPAWLGLTFDDLADVGENPDGVAIAERARAWPEVEAVSHILLFLPPLALGPDRRLAQVIAFSTGPRALQPAVIDGRAPDGVDELFLSPKLAALLGADVGDRLDAAFDASEFTGGEPAETAPLSLQVVGIGPVPVGDGRTIHGATMTYDGAVAALPPEMTADFEEGPRTNVIVVDRADGVTEEAIAERFAAEGVVLGEGGIDRETIAANLVSVDPTSTESAPDLLAGIMALLAGGVLAYGLAITVSRNGRDLAVARALGLTPRMLRRSARWAAAAFAAAALVVGVPIGLVVGRIIWRTYAVNLGVIPDPVVAPGEIAAFVVATFLLALSAGTVAARRQTRRGPGAELRTE